jgi:V/A-type H+-transporting ATPase subunit C
MVKAVFAYANARVKTMQSDLLSQSEIESLASMKDLGEIIHELNQTVYKDDLTSLSVKYSGADLLEAAINRHLVRVFKTVLSLTPDKARGVMALILGEWDIRNIALIISSKALGYSFGPQSDVFLVSSHDYPLGPIAGALSYYDLKNLIDMKDIAGVVEWVARRYGGDYEPYLEKYRTEGDVGPLLLEIELVYLRRLIESVQKMAGSDMRLLSVMKAKIDEKNIVALLKSKARGLNPQDISKFIIDGGNLGRGALNDIYRASGVEELIEGLKPYYDLSDSLPAYRERGLIGIENALNKKIIQRSIGSLRVAPPSLSSIVGYVMLKDLEVGNLTKIVRGKENQVPESEIKESLVFA